jgi:radical SAM superfamily enzyme YgiQ (UPF0313 family)
MKTVIAALNSKYVHLSLAPWYLKSASNDICEIKILELTINQNKAEIMRRIYSEKPDILAFSCYIFNIIHIEAIVKDIKQILPKLKIILGGPEVSYDAVEILQSNANVDYLVCAEGEMRLKWLLACIKAGEKPKEIDGIAYRDGEKIKFTPPVSTIKDLDELPSPYTDEMLEAAKGKIAYFESSRGCPFNCAYCLSPQAGGVRSFSFERVKTDLLRLMRSDARQIKFVDRTFNCTPARAKEIVNFILKEAAGDKKTAEKNYHFEAAADLFDDELITLLSGAPGGLFQLEIGIQSFNEKTLAVSLRKTDLTLCERNIKKLLAAGSMHIHLDLIAGLPYEDFSSFAQSFNRIFALRPHCIQLGFLKLLRGSALHGDAEKYNYKYSMLPPYEVFETPWLSYDELLKLKDMETVVDALYNSGRFIESLKYMVAKFNSSFDFFFEFSQQLKSYYPEGYGIPSRELYNIILKFAREKLGAREYTVFSELLKFDFFSSDNSCNPPTEFVRYEIPGVHTLYDADRASRNRVHYERFAIDPFGSTDSDEDSPVDLKFDYSKKNPVTGLYTAEKI